MCVSCYLGESVAGGKLKETGITHWIGTNYEVTNETGFTALPGGYRYYSGAYINMGGSGYWWNSTEYSTTSAWFRDMTYLSTDVSRANYDKHYGFSVRCVRDF